MNLICAVDENWAIGKDNDLLFPIPEDLKNFRRLTIDRSVICGKNTLLSFPGQKPLPGRRHFVLTHSSLEETEQLIPVGSIEALAQKIRGIPSEELFVIGGGSVYRQLLPYCRKAYITKIFAADPDANVFLPDLDQSEDFVLREEEEIQTSQNGLRFRYCLYENTRARSLEEL